MNVSVVIPTRGDIDVTPVTKSFPASWEVLVYDNGQGVVRTYSGSRWGVVVDGLPDLSVYARYACIEYASHDLILTQDDDVIVSDPQAIVDAWNAEWCGGIETEWDGVVCNMPLRFRSDFYKDHSLVGFGAVFHRDAPKRAFEKFLSHYTGYLLGNSLGHFNRTCDIVFTGLTPCVRVDVPHEDREMASDPNRMWKQADHVAERTRMLELVRQVRTAGGTR